MTTNHEEDQAYKEYRRIRRAFTSPWFWLIAAGFIIIPFTVFSWMAHDDYVNTMQRQGCYVINTFDNGTRVWQCPKGVK